MFAWWTRGSRDETMSVRCMCVCVCVRVRVCATFQQNKEGGSFICVPEIKTGRRWSPLWSSGEKRSTFRGQTDVHAKSKTSRPRGLEAIPWMKTRDARTRARPLPYPSVLDKHSFTGGSSWTCDREAFQRPSHTLWLHGPSLISSSLVKGSLPTILFHILKSCKNAHQYSWAFDFSPEPIQDTGGRSLSHRTPLPLQLNELTRGRN